MVCVVWRLLREEPPKNSLRTTLNLFREAYHDKDISGLDVYTLNHDVSFEKFCKEDGLDFTYGFSAPSGDISFWSPIGNLEKSEARIRLLKLHGSVGWYECGTNKIRRCAFAIDIPENTKRLMIPPQRRKANDTMNPPYSALWSEFRGALGQDRRPINRLVCLGYGFVDEHVNAVIENALARTDFTVVIFAKDLSDAAWLRWSSKRNVIVVTEKRCSVKGDVGEGHHDLWDFERLSKEI